MSALLLLPVTFHRHQCNRMANVIQVQLGFFIFFSFLRGWVHLSIDLSAFFLFLLYIVAFLFDGERGGDIFSCVFCFTLFLMRICSLCSLFAKCASQTSTPMACINAAIFLRVVKSPKHQIFSAGVDVDVGEGLELPKERPEHNSTDRLKQRGMKKSFVGCLLNVPATC